MLRQPACALDNIESRSRRKTQTEIIQLTLTAMSGYACASLVMLAGTVHPEDTDEKSKRKPDSVSLTNKQRSLWMRDRG